MKTFFKSIGGLLVIALLAGAIALYVGWSKLPDMLASKMAEAMRVEVSIHDMGLSMDSISVDKLVIGNVRGGILPKAFSTERIFVNAPVSRYLNKDIVIDQIIIDNSYLGLEFNTPSGTEGNWTTIMGNVERSKQQGAVKTNHDESERTILIKSLVFTDLAVSVVYRKGDQKVKRLPIIRRMELKNISSKGGLPMNQIMHSVLGQMLKEVFVKENLKNMMQELLQPNPANPYDQFIQPFKGLFN